RTGILRIRVEAKAKPKQNRRGIKSLILSAKDVPDTRPDDDPPLVYFGGLDKDNGVLLGLGGSSKHVVGHDGATSTQSRSVTPALVMALLRGLEYPIQ